jgi:hypothetical protein
MTMFKVQVDFVSPCSIFFSDKLVHHLANDDSYGSDSTKRKLSSYAICYFSFPLYYLFWNDLCFSLLTLNHVVGRMHFMHFYR